MKILGISFGRKNQRCDIMVKEALFAARAEGAELEFINTMAMRIDHCHACDYCSRCRDKGEVEIKCCLKDDYHILEEAYLNCDGIIIGAPVYAVGIVGQFKNFMDRLCPSHDRASLLEENKKRAAAGKPLLDERYFKDRYSAYISVGGAGTRNWVALGLPMLHLFDFSFVQKCVGHVDAYQQGITAHPVLDRDLMGRCASLGKAVAQSIGKPYSQTDIWVGEPEEDGTCPVCHCRMLNMNGTTEVECPVCGIWGKMSVKDEKVTIHWPEEEIRRARNTQEGIYEHYNEIQGMIKICISKLSDPQNAEYIRQEMDRYKRFNEIVSSPESDS